MSVLVADNNMEFNFMNKKRLPVSTKGQITIPKKFIQELNIEKEVDCIVDNGIIIIKPAIDETSTEFGEHILRDLIAQGLKDEELIKAFVEQSNNIRSAARGMLEEAHRIALNSTDSKRKKYADLFEMGD